MRTHKPLAFTLPKQMEKEVKTQAKKEHRTISEFIREALRFYMKAQSFSDMQQKLQLHAQRISITEDDVNEMTEEVKNEISKKLRKK